MINAIEAKKKCKMFLNKDIINDIQEQYKEFLEEVEDHIINACALGSCRIYLKKIDGYDKLSSSDIYDIKLYLESKGYKFAKVSYDNDYRVSW